MSYSLPSNRLAQVFDLQHILCCSIVRVFTTGDVQNITIKGKAELR